MMRRLRLLAACGARVGRVLVTDATPALPGAPARQ